MAATTYMYASGERSWAAPVILPDAQLDYWACAYLALPGLARRGISFERFLAATPQVRAVPRLLVQLELRARLERLEAEAAGLSPRHRGAIERLERAGARCENGRWVEPLRHHAHPRSNHRDFQPEVVR